MNIKPGKINKGIDTAISSFLSMSKPGREDIMLLLSAIALLALFQFRGNMSQVEFFGYSAFRWTVARWNDTVSYGGVDYSHGWALPFISFWLVWRRKSELRQADKYIDLRGLAILASATLLHFAGLRIAQTRLSLFALISMLWGLPFYIYGWSVARHLVFPAAYLVFCIPLNFLHIFTFPLRLVATRISVSILNGIGIASVQTGTRILVHAEEQYTFNVADPCSGLRSLLAIAAITAVYGYVSQQIQWKRWTLFLSCVPLAMLGNILRIVSIGVVTIVAGKDIAMQIYHDYSGYFVFAVVVLAMVGASRLLDRMPPSKSKEKLQK